MTDHDYLERGDRRDREPESSDMADGGDLARRNEEIERENQRLRDEIRHMRRRRMRDMEDSNFNERAKVVLDFLPVLDSIERAIEMDSAGENPWFEGFAHTRELFRTTLESLDVHPLPGKGSFFDPNMHEAMASVQVTGHDHNQIIDVIQTGYTIGNRLLRPAKVVVAKNEQWVY